MQNVIIVCGAQKRGFAGVWRAGKFWPEGRTEVKLDKKVKTSTEPGVIGFEDIEQLQKDGRLSIITADMFAKSEAEEIAILEERLAELKAKGKGKGKTEDKGKADDKQSAIPGS